MTSSTIVPTSSEQGVLDSGCTNNLVTSSTPCTDKLPTTNGLHVGIPNGQVMTASHTAKLNLQHLPLQLSSGARAAAVQLELRKSLVSLGQLVD
jgi:hypothetical protein